MASEFTVVHTPTPGSFLAPIGTQEIWAAGFTCYRSRTARMEESKEAGGGSFYDRVYAAERPEIFFKATPQRVAHPGQPMHLRSDSKWMMPEPELTLVINPRQSRRLIRRDADLPAQTRRAGARGLPLPR